MHIRVNQAPLEIPQARRLLSGAGRPKSGSHLDLLLLLFVNFLLSMIWEWFFTFLNGYNLSGCMTPYLYFKSLHFVSWTAHSINSLLPGFLSKSLLTPLLEFGWIWNPRSRWRHGGRLSSEQVWYPDPASICQTTTCQIQGNYTFCFLLSAFTKTITYTQQGNWDWEPASCKKWTCQSYQCDTHLTAHAQRPTSS